MAKEIKLDFINREWIQIDGKNGLISARHNVRKRTVEFDIKYVDGIIEIIYRDSKNMLYESEDDNTRVVHKLIQCLEHESSKGHPIKNSKTFSLIYFQYQ